MEVDNEQTEQELIQTPKKNNKLKIILLVLVLCLAGGLIYKVIESIELDKQKQATQAQLDTAYDALDSMSNELDNRILEVAQLGGEIDTLLQIKNKLEEEKKAFRKRSYTQINQLKDKVNGYKELLVAQDEEIAKLKVLNEKLLVENTELKGEANDLNKSIKDLNSSKSQLEEKVAIASQLRINEFQVIAVNGSGKERTSNIKNRHIDHLKIEFDIVENKVSPIEGKDILIRVTAPDGNVIFDVASGSGSFVFEGRESFYTAKKEILYDRNTQRVSLMYNKASEYQVGKHVVEVFTDDYKMGAGSFTVK